MADIRTEALKEPVDIAEYLFRRIRQMGVKSVHGVPGDYNLVALDYVPKADMKWVGSVNELNAGKCLSARTRAPILTSPPQPTPPTAMPESMV